MVRTLISLDEEDKAWLDGRAQAEGVTMTEVVRTAVRRYRTQCESSEPGESLEHLLGRTAGIWAGGDGLAWQRSVRGEWKDPDPESEI